MFPLKRITCSVLLFAAVFFATLQLVSLTCTNCNEKEVSPAFFELADQIQDGDIILTDSNDFLSRMFKDIRGCGHSGMKIAHKVGGVHHLMVSDIEDLYDLEGGLHLAEMNNYFRLYNDVRIGVFRPKKVTDEQKANVKKLFAKAASATFEGNRIKYDLAYNIDDNSTMMCSKMIYKAYGDAVMDRKRGDDAWWYNGLGQCDLRADSVNQIGQWVSFWKE